MGKGVVFIDTDQCESERSHRVKGIQRYDLFCAVFYLVSNLFTRSHYTVPRTVDRTVRTARSVVCQCRSSVK